MFRSEKWYLIRHCFGSLSDSFPIFCINLLKISYVCLLAKLKRIHYWWCYTVYNFGRYCTFVPPIVIDDSIMKKCGWKLYRSPNPNPRGVRKCNSAQFCMLLSLTLRLWWILILFCSASICWNSLVSSLYATLSDPFHSWTLLIKLFDCHEQNIKTNGP